MLLLMARKLPAMRRLPDSAGRYAMHLFPVVVAMAGARKLCDGR